MNKGGNMAKSKTKESKPANLDELLLSTLDKAYEVADDYFVTKKSELPNFATDNLSDEFISSLEAIASLCEKASTGYLNVLTGLTIKAALGKKVDVRYHQVQIQSQTDRPAGFNFRGISEHIMYKWMQAHEFPGAKSGWQTRTYERPKPYKLNYDENIGDIKEPFLKCYDQIEEHDQDAFMALAFLLWRREQLREKSKIVMSIPKITNVIQITELFERHFFFKYKDSKGASRLPVLALYAIYEVLLSELQRFDNKTLKELQAHSAADSQTGSVGDIEVANQDGSIFEAVEVKHEIPITIELIESAKQKIRGSQVERYYILTTFKDHTPSDEIQNAALQVEKLLGCQMIVNGVIPSIKYYLRLLTNPGKVLPVYVDLLTKDKAITFEHRDIWNKITTGTIIE